LRFYVLEEKPKLKDEKPPITTAINEQKKQKQKKNPGREDKKQREREISGRWGFLGVRLGFKRGHHWKEWLGNGGGHWNVVNCLSLQRRKLPNNRGNSKAKHRQGGQLLFKQTP